MEKTTSYKKILYILLTLLLVFGIFTRILSLNKPFTAEETDFIKPAISLIKIGSPTSYVSEQMPEITFLFHPPMYIFLLSLIFKLNISEISARLLNVFLTLTSALLIYAFCSKLIDKKKGKIIGAIAGTIFLINYYILSSSLLIDIDPSSTLFVLSFIFFILMNQKTGKDVYFIASVIALFLAIFNRYPIAFITFVSLGAYTLYLDFKSKKGYKLTVKYILSGIISFAIFLVVWGIYSTLVEPGHFLSFITHNIALGSEPLSNPKFYIASFAMNLAQLVRLLTFPFVILSLMSVIYFLRNRSKISNFILIYSLASFLFFILIPRPAFGYPRYFMTAIPGFCILISLYVYEKIKSSSISGKKTLIVLAVTFIISLFILIFLSPQLTLYDAGGLIRATNLPDFIFNIFASSPLLLILFLKDKRRNIYFIIAVLALFLSYSFYFNINYVKHDSKIREVSLYIQEHTSKNDIIITPKAVGYYAERRFYNNDNNKPPLNVSSEYLLEYFDKSLKDRQMNDPFFWPKGFHDSFFPPQPSAEDLSSVKYAVLYHPIYNTSAEIKIGEFYVYNLQ